MCVGVHGRYAKTRLVMFGEYIPFRDQLAWLRRRPAPQTGQARSDGG